MKLGSCILGETLQINHKFIYYNLSGVILHTLYHSI